MSAAMNGQQQYVPWSVYMQDRHAQAEANRRLEGKLDRLTEKVEALTIAVATDDVAEQMAEAATEGIERARRSRTERLWELVKQTWAAALALLGAALVYWITGGPPS